MPKRSIPGIKAARAIKLAEAKAAESAKEASWRAARARDRKIDAEIAAAEAQERAVAN